MQKQQNIKNFACQGTGKLTGLGVLLYITVNAVVHRLLTLAPQCSTFPLVSDILPALHKNLKTLRRYEIVYGCVMTVLSGWQKFTPFETVTS